MRKNPDGQLELVLENRQVLIAFFVIVALCGVFFSLGYIVGRNTFSSVVRVTQAAAGTAEGVTKPSPMSPLPSAAPNPENPPSTEPGGEPAAPATDLNFYQSVEEKTPDAKLVPPETRNASPAPSRPPAAEKQTPLASAPPPATPPAALPDAFPPGILVQVSALTRREDAGALVGLIKEKKLPVRVVSGTGDSLFHVVVGPYKNLKDAEHAKAELEKDGFRPIIRK
jgi:DedD protein